MSFEGLELGNEFCSVGLRLPGYVGHNRKEKYWCGILVGNRKTLIAKFYFYSNWKLERLSAYMGM